MCKVLTFHFQIGFLIQQKRRGASILPFSSRLPSVLDKRKSRGHVPVVYLPVPDCSLYLTRERGDVQVFYFPFSDFSSYSTRERREVQVSYLPVPDWSSYLTRERGKEMCNFLTFHFQTALHIQQENEEMCKCLYLSIPDCSLYSIWGKKRGTHFLPSISTLLFIFKNRKRRDQPTPPPFITLLFITHSCEPLRKGKAVSGLW